jgi:hypothetical protein
MQKTPHGFSRESSCLKKCAKKFQQLHAIKWLQCIPRQQKAHAGAMVTGIKACGVCEGCCGAPLPGGVGGVGCCKLLLLGAAGCHSECTTQRSGIIRWTEWREKIRNSTECCNRQTPNQYPLPRPYQRTLCAEEKSAFAVSCLLSKDKGCGGKSG